MPLGGQVIGWNVSIRCGEIEANGNLGESSFNGIMRAEANLVDVESKKIKTTSADISGSERDSCRGSEDGRIFVAGKT